MKVIVFGATGTVGKLTVEQLLAAGHKVTAFARHPEKLAIQHHDLSLAAGDALSADDVMAALPGHDVVVVTLGAGMSRRSVIRSEGTMNIINAMHAHGIRRLICQSTLGTGDTWRNLNFFWKRIMFGLLLRPVFADHVLQEKLVRASGLDWTIVRPSAFVDGPATGGFRENFGPSVRGLSLKISRADVAGFLVRQLDDWRYAGRAVSISN
jgi:uncharacterized protein YbjT (DUF2867 family)